MTLEKGGQIVLSCSWPVLAGPTAILLFQLAKFCNYRYKLLCLSLLYKTRFLYLPPPSVLCYFQPPSPALCSRNIPCTVCLSSSERPPQSRFHAFLSSWDRAKFSKVKSFLKVTQLLEGQTIWNLNPCLYLGL